MKITVLSSVLMAVALGCAGAAEHRKAVQSDERELTLGNAQREIKVGMSQADVATALGSPNIVTKDGDGNETWIYDKIASEAAYSKSGAGTGLLVSLFVGGQSSSGAASTSQRTLTVVIRFDADSRVKNVSYHASKF